MVPEAGPYPRKPAFPVEVFGSDHTFLTEPPEGLAKVCDQTGRAAKAKDLSTRAQRIRAQAEAASAKPQPQT